SLSFAQLEASGKRHIELPHTGTGNAVGTHISKIAGGRQREGRRIQVVLNRFVAIRVGQYLINALVEDGGQPNIRTGYDAHVSAGEDFKDRRNAPTRSEGTQRG